jgi:hypothetical protein
MMFASKVGEKTMKTMAALTLIFAAAPVHAETVYKYVEPDGGVVYSNDPITGATPTKRLILDPATNVVQPPPAVSEKSVDESRRLRELQAQRETRENARQEVVVAQQALAAAEAALIAGREPLPGERHGACVANGTSAGSCMTLNSNGVAVQGDFTSRLNEGYFDRVAALEAEVEKARARLQEAMAREKGY